MPPILIATRGSDLALAQANAVLAACRKAFPRLDFELKIIKTTGDRLQTQTPAAPGALPDRALFTKELETALLHGRADLAVHSLKDLPTDLPRGLRLAAVAGERADVRDVLVYRIDNGLVPGMKISEFPPGLTVATGSLRRQTQLLALRPDFLTVPIRGNVPTRLRKLLDQPETDATILAAAGLDRLGIRLARMGLLRGDRAPRKLAYYVFEPRFMLPCVGQGAIGLEIRDGDKRAAKVCRLLNHDITFQCVAAERSFLQAMGGGCQTPIGAYASVTGARIHLRAVAHLTRNVQRAEGTSGLPDAVALGREVADQLRRQQLQPRP
jgi:hydroxymethylbilane synthase